MDAKPVVVWQIPDEAWKNVAQGISQVVEMLLAKPRFTIYIPQKLYTELMMHLMSNYPKAARGILGILGSTKVVKHYPTANAAENYVGDLKALINVDDITRIMNDIDDYDGDPISIIPVLITIEMPTLLMLILAGQRSQAIPISSSRSCTILGFFIPEYFLLPRMAQ